MDDVTTRSTDETVDARPRPAWARRIHHFGDDLRWACSGWCGFPRPVRRAAAAVVTTAGGWIVGADDFVARLVDVVRG